MKQRPKILIPMGILFCLIAISFPVQIMSLYGHGFGETAAILHKLTYLNWLVMIGLTFTAVLVIQASPHLKYALPIMFVVVAINNFFVGYHGTDYSPWSAALATLGFGALNFPLIKSADIRFLIANPDQRWWRIHTRKPVHLPVVLTGDKFQRVRGETYDISETGIFMPIAEGEVPPALQEKVTVTISLGTFAQIRCEGRVVRHAEAKGKYPSGIGIEFLDLSHYQKTELRKFLARQPLEGQLRQ